MYNLTSLEDRKKILEYINSGENIERKKKSIKRFQVYKNKLNDHVTAHISNYIGPASLKQMAVIKDVGMCERIINQEASIYLRKPKRDFTNVTDEQKEKLRLIYKDMQYDKRNKKHNRYFKLQHQCASIIVPKGKKLVKKPLLEHQYDIIPNHEDPETPQGFVLSSPSQPKDADKQRYVIWTSDFHFKMDGNGLIIGEVTNIDSIKNPIAPIIPIVVASDDKDGEYYPDSEETSVDFTITLNAALTELYHVMRMQGFGQAVMIGSQKSMPKAETIEVGINSVIALVTEEGGGTADFKFVNANPDLAGTIDVISTLLSSYLSSKGIDPKTVSIKGDSPQTFASGWERFLSLIKEFEATEDDMEIFQDVEANDFNVVRAWHNILSGTDTINTKYLSGSIPEIAEIKTEFQKPEMIMTEPEKIASVKSEEEAGYIDHIGAIKKVRGLESDEDAINYYNKMQENNSKYPRIAKTEDLNKPDDSNENQDNQDDTNNEDDQKDE